MYRLFREALTIEVLPGRGSILPSGILISGHVDDDQNAVIEVACEEDIAANFVHVRTLEGEMQGHFPLLERDTGLGRIRYGEVVVPGPVQYLAIDICDIDQTRLDSYSVGIDCEEGIAFPLPKFAGFLPEDPSQRSLLLSFGPNGSRRCPAVVNIRSIQSTVAGISLDVLLDDPGICRRIYVSMVQMGHRVDGAAGKPRMSTAEAEVDTSAPEVLEIPLMARLGTFQINWQFFDAKGVEIPDYSCTLDLQELSLAPPGPNLDMVHATSAGGGFAIQAPTPATAPRDARTSHGTSPGVSRRMDLVQEFESFVRTWLKDTRPPKWPEMLGEDGEALGPRGYLGLDRALQIVEHEVKDGKAILTIAIDDSGLTSEVVVGKNGEILGKGTVQRATDVAHGIVKVEAPLEAEELVFFARDRFGWCIPNLSAGLGTQAKSFRRMELPHPQWYPKFRFRDPLDFSSTFCAICRIPLREETANLLVDLDAHLREAVRRRRSRSPDMRGVCDRCLARLEHDQSSWTGWKSYIQPENMILFTSRVVLALAGACLPLTRPGQALLTRLGPDGFNLLTSNDALLAVGLLGGLILACLPYRIFIKPIMTTISSFLSTKKDPPPLEALIGPALLVGTLVYFFTRRAPLTGDAVWIFHGEILPFAALVSLCGGLVVTLLGFYAERLERMETIRDEVQMQRVGEIYEQASQLLRSRNVEEFELLLTRFVIEGLRAFAYQIFHYDAKRHRYVPKTQGGISARGNPPLSYLAHGEKNLPAQAATLGRPLAMENLVWDKGVDAATLEDRTCQVAIPVGRVGRVDYVINIMTFRDTLALVALLPVLRGIWQTLNNGYEAAHQPYRRDDKTADNAFRPRPESLVDSFGAYFPPDFIKRVESEPHLLSLNGERAEITVMHITFVNFGEVTRDWLARERVTVLSSLFTALAPLVVRTGGYIEGIRESTMQVLFGRPQNLPDYAVHACKAACEVIAGMPQVYEGVDPALGNQLRVRIGLATGPSDIGNIGTLERFEYSLISPSVELARAMTLATDYYGVDILACPRTVELVRGRAGVRRLDQVRLSEVSQPRVLFQLLGYQDTTVTNLTQYAIGAYREGLSSYLEGKYKEATEKFDSVLKACPEDRPGKILHDRCVELARKHEGDPPRPVSLGLTDFKAL